MSQPSVVTRETFGGGERNAATVTITVTDDSCSVTKCNTEVSRGQDVTFELQNFERGIPAARHQ